MKNLQCYPNLNPVFDLHQPTCVCCRILAQRWPFVACWFMHWRGNHLQFGWVWKSSGLLILRHRMTLIKDLTIFEHVTGNDLQYKDWNLCLRCLTTWWALALQYPADSMSFWRCSPNVNPVVDLHYTTCVCCHVPCISISTETAADVSFWTLLLLHPGFERELDSCL